MDGPGAIQVVQGGAVRLRLAGSFSAQPSGPGAASLAATMSGLLGSLADQVAQDLRDSTARA